ncbi:MAG TPA: outer membrane protein assembly factor BamE [Gammaproteobacteria bacterium]|nr:outer membrane protein assembly factor BamE [Gammaproteobacteria bacterium]
MILRTTLISTFLDFFQFFVRPSALKPLFFLGVLALSASVSSCAEWLPEAHKLDLQQGNSVKLEQLEQLELGMTKAEVRQTIGTPMLTDPFHNQRWDYIYRFIPNKGFERKSLLTIYFDENGRLKRIDDSKYIEP